MLSPAPISELDAFEKQSCPVNFIDQVAMMKFFLRQDFLKMLLVVHRGRNNFPRARNRTEQAYAIDRFRSGLPRLSLSSRLGSSAINGSNIGTDRPGGNSFSACVTSSIPSPVTTPKAIVVKSADAHGHSFFSSQGLRGRNARIPARYQFSCHRERIVGIEPRVSIRAFVSVSEAAPDFLL